MSTITPLSVSLSPPSLSITDLHQDQEKRSPSIHSKIVIANRVKRPEHLLIISEKILQYLGSNTKYIQIAGRRFKYTVDQHQRGKSVLAQPYIISDLHACSSLNTSQTQGQYFSLTPYYPSKERKAKDAIETVDIQLLSQSNPSTLPLDAEKVASSFSKAFNKDYLTAEQTVQFSLNENTITAKIARVIRAGKNIWKPGRITKNTKIEVKPAQTGTVTLQKLVDYAQPRITCKVSFAKDRKYAPPVYVSYSALEKLAIELNKDKNVFHGAEWSVNLPGLSPLTCQVSKIEDLANGEFFVFEANEKLKKALKVSASTQFVFESFNSYLALGNDEKRNALFVMGTIQQVRSKNPDNKNLSHIYADEIIQALKKMSPNGVYSGMWHVAVEDRNKELQYVDLFIEGFSDVKEGIPKTQKLQSKWELSEETELSISSIQPQNVPGLARTRKTKPAKRITANVWIYKKPPHGSPRIDKKKLEHFLRQNFRELIEGETFFYMDSENRHVSLKISSVEGTDATTSLQNSFSTVHDQTQFDFKVANLIDATGKPLPKSTQLYDTRKAALYQEMDTESMLEQLDIVALPQEMIDRIDIIRRKFRKAKEIADLGMRPPRVLIFSGPPGTSKTHLSLAFAKLLGVEDENHINITSTELLDKYWGGTEENALKLFKSSDEDYAKYGSEMPLHLISIQEIDCIAPDRNSNAIVNTRTIVAQLLGMLDGSKNDKVRRLVIMTANNLDIIDAALKRSGRTDEIFEFEIPDLGQTKKIFTHYIKKNLQILDQSLNLESIVNRLPRMTGADVQKVIEKAKDFALLRQKKSSSPFLLLEEDFNNTLDRIVKPRDDLPMFI